VSDAELAITVEDRDGRRIVAVHGEVDLATADQLRGALADPGAAGELVADLAGVDFMDSAGLGVLARAAVDLREAGVRLVVARLTSRVRRVIEISGLDQALTVVDDVD
jgi:anti-sigma B factor antagonist